jgi:hypothetical protein
MSISVIVFIVAHHQNHIDFGDSVKNTQDRQCKYNVILTRFRLTTAAVEKQ